MRALLSASRSRRDELVKSCNRLESTSKLMTNARSLGRKISLRKLAPTSFSISRTLCWLPLESIRIPRVRGRSDSAAKYLMVCRLAVFEKLEIVLGQAGNQPAFLVFDVEKELHHVDVDLQRADRLVPLLGLVLPGSDCPDPECRPGGVAAGRRPDLRENGWRRSRQSPKLGLQTPETCGLSASRYSPALFVSLFHQG